MSAASEDAGEDLSRTPKKARVPPPSESPLPATIQLMQLPDVTSPGLMRPLLSFRADASPTSPQASKRLKVSLKGRQLALCYSESEVEESALTSCTRVFPYLVGKPLLCKLQYETTALPAPADDEAAPSIASSQAPSRFVQLSSTTVCCL